jgi:hypothetical protein
MAMKCCDMRRPSAMPCLRAHDEGIGIIRNTYTFGIEVKIQTEDPM